MWLGFYAELTREEQDYVINNLIEVLDELKQPKNRIKQDKVISYR